MTTALRSCLTTGDPVLLPPGGPNHDTAPADNCLLGPAPAPVERSMSELSAVCATTGKPIWTGIHTDSLTLAKIWFSDVTVKCPHCGKNHAIKIREAYIEAALSYDGLRGTRAAAAQRGRCPTTRQHV